MKHVSLSWSYLQYLTCTESVDVCRHQESDSLKIKTIMTLIQLLDWIFTHKATFRGPNAPSQLLAKLDVRSTRTYLVGNNFIKLLSYVCDEHFKTIKA